MVVFHQASVQAKPRALHNNAGTVRFLVNMSLQCYLPELELGPALDAGRGLAECALQLQLLYTATYSYN